MTDVFAPQFPTDARDVVRSFNSDGSANFDQVGFEELDFSAVFGGKTSSTTQNAIEYGIKTFTLDVDDGKIQVGYPIQCQSLDDPECFMQGVVVRKDTVIVSPAEIDIAVVIISPLVNTSNNWELQVVPVAGFSVQPSATAGISTSSVDASGAGPFTFVTQSDKLFMQIEALQGTVVCSALADPSVYLFGRILANASTNLVLEKIYSNATGSHDAWSVQMFDGPDNGLLFTDCIGLSLTHNGAQELTITAGSCRDSTNTIDLVLTGTLEKDISLDFTEGDGGGTQVYSGNLTGTITVSGTTVTGSGTQFLTDIPPQTQAVSSARPVINFNGNRRLVSSVSTDTAAVTSSSGADSVGVTFTRGGYSTVSFAGYLVVLARRDDTGICDIITAQSSTSYVPDLPVGYTYYRKLASINLQSGNLNDSGFQVVLASPQNAVPYLRTASAAFPNAVTLGSSTSVILSTSGFGSVHYTPKRAALTGDVTASQDSNSTTIAANAVTNTKLADMAAYTLKARNAGTTGDPSDMDISALTEKTALANDDLFLIQDSAASNAFKKVKRSNVGGGDSAFGPATMFVAASL